MNAEFCVSKAPGPFVLSKYQIWIPNKGWDKRKTDNFLIYAQTSTWKSNNRSVFGKYINVIIPRGRCRVFFWNFTVDISLVENFDVFISVEWWFYTCSVPVLTMAVSESKRSCCVDRLSAVPSSDTCNMCCVSNRRLNCTVPFDVLSTFRIAWHGSPFVPTGTKGPTSSFILVSTE